ncbi:hypothetical protein KCP76_05690 [Salmonella enterica subsp. enterica serovar Weltevreden]|nr:hypothetical protein KCP76_05690 [Salmonella enterica subsp. enterica serovar Weltevreden]
MTTLLLPHPALWFNFDVYLAAYFKVAGVSGVREVAGSFTCCPVDNAPRLPPDVSATCFAQRCTCFDNFRHPETRRIIDIPQHHVAGTS